MGFIFNVISKLLKTVIKLSLYLAIIATIIILIPNLPPYSKFSTIQVTPIQPRVGPLAINDALNNAGRSYSGKLLGPEAFQIFKGELYTSLATGEIVKLSPEGHVTFVTKIGQPCSGIIHEHICGRPLGFVIDDKDGTLYVADAYHGIWKVNLKTDKKQLLVSPRVEIEKRHPKLFNSIALAKNGDLYWTDSTSDFHLKDGAISFMTDPSGRLLHYDAAKNQSKVLLDDLWFTNGVVLSPNSEFVLVSESARGRIIKYYISGPKKGKSEVFVDGLPGVPDNMRALPDGSGILVALYTVYEEDRPPLTQLLAATPAIRKLAARLQRLIEIPFEYLNTIYPHILLDEIVYFIGHFKSISGLTPPMSGLLQIDWDGNFVAGYYNTDKTLGHVSDAIVFNGKLCTGSPHLQDFVGTVPAPPLLKKAFELPQKSDAPKVEKTSQQAKPVQHAPVKTEEKPKPKVEEVPKVQTKPKVEDKPKTPPKPVEEKAKVKVAAPKIAKPAAAESKPPPPAKPAAAQAKPVAEQPKPAAQQAKPAEQQAKPAPQQDKPAAPQPAPKKPSQEAKASQQVPKTPSPSNPTPATKKSEPANASTKTETKSTPQPEKTTPPPKPVEKTTSPPSKATPKQAETRNETPKKPQAPHKQEPPKNVGIKPKPIKEEIPSDTAKPTTETLKVIKKDGPAEIPVPNQ